MKKIRLFGSEDCDQCKMVRHILNSNNIKYEFIDAFSDDTQSLCDDNNVEEIPHIQLLKNEEVIEDFIGEDALNVAIKLTQ